MSILTNQHLLRDTDLIGAWPKGVAADELAQGRLVSLAVSLDEIVWPVGVATRKLARLSPAADALLAMLRDVGRDAVRS